MKTTSPFFIFIISIALTQSAETEKLKLNWSKNMLTINGDHLPGQEMKIHYLEAYCRANSHTADWVNHTVIGLSLIHI